MHSFTHSIRFFLFVSLACSFPAAHAAAAAAATVTGAPGRSIATMHLNRETGKAERNNTRISNGGGSRAWSVEDTVRRALAGNPSLAAARSRVKQAKSRLEQARSAFAARVGFDLSYTRSDAPSVYLFKKIDAGSLPAGTDFNDPGVLDNLEAGITVNYNLLDSGRKQLGRARAGNGLAAGRRDLDAATNELIGTAIQAHFDILAADEFVKVARQSLETVKAQLKDVKVRFRHGGALRSDVLSIEVRKAQADERLISAENAAELARAALRGLLDLDPGQTVTLSPEEWKPAPLPTDLSTCLELALGQRPELAAIDYRIAAAKNSVSIAGRLKRPRLDLQGRCWVDDDSTQFESDRANWSLGAALTWNFGDGGMERALRKESTQRLEELRNRRRALVRQIEQQVHQALLNLEEAVARAKVARANVERAKENLLLVERLFTGGSATVTRYLQAEQDRTKALFREIRSRYDVKKAKAALGHVTGLCVQCTKGWKR